MAQHVQGHLNVAADALPHNHLSIFFTVASGRPLPHTSVTQYSGPVNGHISHMDISALDPALLFYCSQGVAQTTARTYSVGLGRFYNFCAECDILQPLPVSEQLLCYFVAALANQGLSPATIRTYLTAIRNSQVARGWPMLGRGAGLPKLRLVQNGVARAWAQ